MMKKIILYIFTMLQVFSAFSQDHKMGMSNTAGSKHLPFFIKIAYKETIGKKNSRLQIERFNSNSRPFYVLLDMKGQKLAEPVGAEYDADSYAHYLKQGIQ